MVGYPDPLDVLEVTDKVKDYLAEIGRRGGQAKGKAKVRGDSEYYKRISAKAAKARKAKRASDSGTGSKK
jgi:hypothetical protein